MANFDVTTQSLGEIARLLQTAIATFDARVTNSDGVVHNIVNATWEGQDADLFATSWSQWHTQAMAVRESLESIALTLIAAQAGYEGVENALDGGFDTVTSQMTPKAQTASVTSTPTQVVA